MTQPQAHAIGTDGLVRVTFTFDKPFDAPMSTERLAEYAKATQVIVEIAFWTYFGWSQSRFTYPLRKASELLGKRSTRRMRTARRMERLPHKSTAVTAVTFNSPLAIEVAFYLSAGSAGIGVVAGVLATWERIQRARIATAKASLEVERAKLLRRRLREEFASTPIFKRKEYLDALTLVAMDIDSITVDDPATGR